MTTATQKRQATTEDIERFCAALTERSAADYEKHGFTFGSRVFRPSTDGRVYIRICGVDLDNDGREVSRSAHCFVKIEDGTLWKPAGWKGPAKNFPRGMVFDDPATTYVGNI